MSKEKNTLPKIGIIGSEGVMGKIFTKFFKEHNYLCLKNDYKLKTRNNIDIIEKSDVIILCLPLSSQSEFIKTHAKNFNNNKLLIDISSVKTPFVTTLKKIKADVLSFHPMFGSLVLNKSNILKKYKENTIIKVPIKRNRLKITEEIERLFDCFTVETLNYSKHDKLMADIQVLNHMDLLAFRLTEHKIEFELKNRYSSPSYKLRMMMMKRIFSQNPEIYADISLMNPYAKEKLSNFLKNYLKVYSAIKEKNKKKIIELFRRGALLPRGRGALRAP